MINYIVTLICADFLISLCCIVGETYVTTVFHLPERPRVMGFATQSSDSVATQAWT